MRVSTAHIAALLLAFCLTGCGKGTSGGQSSGSSRKLPDNVELSKTEGVSIVQLPQGTQYVDPNIGATSYLSGDGIAGPATARNELLSDIIWNWAAFGTGFKGWFSIDAELPDARYHVTISLKEGQTVGSLLREAFEPVFGLRFAEANEMLDVHLLVKTRDVPEGLTKVQSETAHGGTTQTPGGFGYMFKAETMTHLASLMEKYVDGPVLDETGLDGFYAFTLSMDHWKPQTVHPALEALGLRLQPARREVHTLRVKNAQ